jgi:hypothetical protein
VISSLSRLVPPSRRRFMVSFMIFLPATFRAAGAVQGGYMVVAILAIQIYVLSA